VKETDGVAPNTGIATGGIHADDPMATNRRPGDTADRVEVRVGLDAEYLELYGDWNCCSLLERLNVGETDLWSTGDATGTC